jgi:hypothetical protein
MQHTYGAIDVKQNQAVGRTIPPSPATTVLPLKREVGVTPVFSGYCSAEEPTSAAGFEPYDSKLSIFSIMLA